MFSVEVGALLFAPATAEVGVGQQSICVVESAGGRLHELPAAGLQAAPGGPSLSLTAPNTHCRGCSSARHPLGWRPGGAQECVPPQPDRIFSEPQERQEETSEVHESKRFGGGDGSHTEA